MKYILWTWRAFLTPFLLVAIGLIYLLAWLGNAEADVDVSSKR